MAPGDDLLTTLEVAAILRLRPQTLRKLRSRGDGPAYVRFGRGSRGGRVVYARSDVAAWVAAHRVGEGGAA